MTRRIIIIILGLYALAISLICLPETKQLIQIEKSRKVKTVYRQSPEELTSVPFEAVQPPNIASNLKLNTNKSYNIIGEIVIPSQQMSLELYPGISDDLLLLGASALYPERQAREDSIVLLGHHLRQQEMLFGKLMAMTEGESIYLHYYAQYYEYVVTALEEVSESDLSVLANQEKGVLKLITCPEPTRTKKRWVVTGKLVELEKQKINAKSFEKMTVKYQVLDDKKQSTHKKMIIGRFLSLLLIGSGGIWALLKNTGLKETS